MLTYYNDIDPFCCKVLRKRIEAGDLPAGDVDERDIREVDPAELVGYGHIHLFAGLGAFALGFKRAGVPATKRILTAGFPCQPVSQNGEKKAQDDERWLWPETARIVRALRLDFTVLENVTGLLARGLHVVLGDLACLGLDAEWDSIPAAAFGAPHLRERVFLVAYPSSQRPQGQEPAGRIWGRGLLTQRDWWPAEPELARLGHGIPNRVAGTVAMGNAIVPAACEEIGRRIVAAC